MASSRQPGPDGARRPAKVHHFGPGGGGRRAQAKEVGPDGSLSSDGRTRLLLGVGVLVAVCAVIAGLVIFAGGEQAAPPVARAALSAGRTDLVVGKGGAPASVVVREDFGDPDSRSFDIASRDFLEIMASQGRVRVTYQPVHGSAAPTGWSRTALGAWAAVLRDGTPRQALKLQRLLLDEQPAPGETAPGVIDLARRAGVRDTGLLASLSDPPSQELLDAGARTPAVLLDGRPVTGRTPVQQADALQRALLATRR